MRKTAQTWGYYAPAHNAEDAKKSQIYGAAANAHIIKGMGRGAKEIVPGFIDQTIGNISGAVNGIMPWNWNRFARAFDESKGFVRDYYTNPIRKAFIPLKKLDFTSYVDNNLRKRIGDVEFAKEAPSLKTMENVAAKATEFAGQVPIYGGAVLAKPIAAATAGMGGLGLAIRSGDVAAGEQAFADYNAKLQELSGMNPASPEYAQLYGALKASSRINPVEFGKMPAPTYNPVSSGAQTRQLLWQDMIPGGKGMAYGALGGLGGALLGGLFGRKGSWLKLGLLGMLLGGLHGSGALDSLLNGNGNVVTK